MADADLDIFLSACRDHGGGEPSEALVRATAFFVHHAVHDLQFLKTAAAALPSLAADGAAWLAVAIGAAIEQGDGVEQTAPAVVDLFLSWLPRLPARDRRNDENSAL